MQLEPKKITKELKIKLLSEHFEKGISISELSRLNGIHPVTLYKWKRLMKNNEESHDVNALLQEIKQLKKEKDQLLKAYGGAKLDNELLKDLNDFLKKKYQNQQSKLQKNLLQQKKKNTEI
jgi:transposase-like protein